MCINRRIIIILIFSIMVSIVSPMANIRAASDMPDWVIDQGTYLVNKSDKAHETRVVEGYEITLISFYHKDGQSTFLADATNITEEKKSTNILDIYFYDKDGETIASIGGIVGETKPGKTVQINASATVNLVRAYDWEIYFADEETGEIPSPTPRQTSTCEPVSTLTPDYVVQRDYGKLINTSEAVKVMDGYAFVMENLSSQGYMATVRIKV